MGTVKNLLIVGALVLVFSAFAVFPGISSFVAGTNRFQQNSLGYVQNGVDWETASVDENISLLSVATVYANISRSTFFVAVENNSVLYAKSHIFCVFHVSNVSSDVEFPVTKKSVREIYIFYQNLTFLIRVKWVNSVNEISELSEEPSVALSLVFQMLWTARAYIFVASLLGVFAGIKIRKWWR